jgi:hypothetical protein
MFQVAVLFYCAEIITGCSLGFAVPLTAETPIAKLMKVNIYISDHEQEVDVKTDHPCH